MSSRGERACLECRHWSALPIEPRAELELRRDEAAGGVHVPIPSIGECRARPPVVFMLPVQGARLDGKNGVQLNFPAAWPRTEPLQWCGGFERELEGAIADALHPALRL